MWYVDQNPVEAGQCHVPHEWMWSGCSATLGLTRARPFHDVDEQLGLLGSSPMRGRAVYRQLLENGPPHAGALNRAA